MDETMDRYLCYRNLLALEDHILELLMSPEDSEERELLLGFLNEVRYNRDDVLPDEKNKKYHCVVKHLSTAYEAALEVAKATQEDIDFCRAEVLRSMLYDAISKCLDRKVIVCERCGVKEENGTRGVQTENTRSFIDSAFDGLTRDSVQRVSPDRVHGLYSRETSSSDGDEDSDFKRNFEGREGKSTSDPFGESA